MNAWNARSGTTANNLCACLVLGLGLLAAPAACAQEDGMVNSAPSLLGIKEILVQHARLGNNAASDSCGLIPSGPADEILKSLQLDQIPSFSAMQAPPSRMGVARIEIVPEVVTMQRQGIDCTSWVALTAQARSTLRVPPIDVPRSVMITYWRGGLMVSSPTIAHARAVKEAVGKLAKQFGLQYKRDQPPPLPDLDSTSTKSLLQ